ncbi:atlastin-2-like [Ornithodoros turicata]|uniref:atlastin-2-like n=1 Tax=Ornithodoros turicata TaxID=34597 RepID=UPI00313A0A22
MRLMELHATGFRVILFFVSCASVLKGAQDCKDAQKMFALDTLLFLARDWENAQEIPYGLDMEGDFHGEWLTPNHSTLTSLKSIQRGIKECTKSIFSFLMPHPGDQIKQPNYDGRLQGLCEEFKQCLDSLASLLFSPERLTPKMLNGRPVTCNDFKGLLLTYSSVCKHGTLPEVQTVTDQAAYVHNQKVLKNIDHEYESAMADGLQLLLEKQGKEDKTVALEKEHNRLKQEALSKLGNTPVMGDKMSDLQKQLSQASSDVKYVIRSYYFPTYLVTHEIMHDDHYGSSAHFMAPYN